MFLRKTFLSLILTSLSWTATAQDTDTIPNIFIEKAKSSEKSNIQEWVDESLKVLQSEEFYENLKTLESKYPEVWLSKYEKTRTISQLTEILKAKDPAKEDEAYLPTGIRMKGRSKKDNTRDIGYKGNTFASIGPRSSRKSLPLKMRLGRVHLDRYVTGDIVEKSCAINTMTHEISHTLSISSTKLQSYFLDIPAGLAPPGVPSASYFIGTVAQCTYLQKNGRITKDQFEGCMAVFVAQPFPSSRCDDFPDGKLLE